MDIRQARILSHAGAAALLFAASAVLHGTLTRNFTSPFPHYRELVLGAERLQDMAFLSAGFRRLAADAAWIQYLQYLGRSEDIAESQDLLRRTQRVTRLDPSFRRAYLYGAGLLAWSPRAPRPQEAVVLLREGIARNPQFWRLHALLAAIAYKEGGQEARMLAALERTAFDPESPAMIKSIVANLYKKNGRVAEAMRIWIAVLDDSSAVEYHDRAMSELGVLEQMRQGKR